MVLPILWLAVKDAVPPSVVLNGGCAMRLPGAGVQWPPGAVTVMLLGGKDFFRNGISRDEYLDTTCQCVPQWNQSLGDRVGGVRTAAGRAVCIE